MERWMSATDDVTEADLEDMTFFKKMDAYTRCPRGQVADVGAHIVTCAG